MNEAVNKEIPSTYSEFLDGLLADIKVLAGSGPSPLSADNERPITTLLLGVARNFVLCESEVHQIYRCCKRIMRGSLSVKDTEISYTPGKFDGYGTVKMHFMIKEDRGLCTLCIEITRKLLPESQSISASSASRIEISKDSVGDDSRGFSQHFDIGEDYIAYYASCVDTSHVPSGGMMHQRAINRVWRM